MEIIKNQKSRILKWLLVWVAVFLLVILIPSAAYLLFEKKFESRIYPGVHIGPYDVSGLTHKQAQMILTKRVDAIKQGGIAFSYLETRHIFFPIVSSLESDLVYQNIDFEVDKVVDKAYAVGRQGNFQDRFLGKLRSAIYHINIKPEYAINKEAVYKFLNDNFSNFERPAEDAKIAYTGNYSYQPEDFEVIEEKYGQIIDYDKALKDLEKNLYSYANQDIALQAAINYPAIHKADCLNIENQAVKLLNKTPLDLVYENLSWTIKKEDIVDWLKLKPGGTPGEKVFVGLDHGLLGGFLKQEIAGQIDQEPQDARFEIKDGKVSEFQASQDGQELSIEGNAKLIESRLLTGTSSRVELQVLEVKSKITNDTVNDLGIKEIIGTGHSNFAGSPANRRHNIKNGADALNGILIKPDEELSLIETLGDIDAANGYLPELVIKGNETIPEYGGGLCQIGTTLFRATLASGLPVTQRRNHSYRVSYYEPAGTDATIYDPWPDYKFKNDTPFHILIQSRIEGNDLYFDFWSTEDGRISTTTYPVIYNIVKPPPTKIIETDKLGPGEKKCTESAHAGADAYFDYTVDYPKSNPPEKTRKKIAGKEEVLDEDYTVQTRFKSHYVPWQAVCLVGVDPSASSSQETLLD